MKTKTLIAIVTFASFGLVYLSYLNEAADDKSPSKTLSAAVDEAPPTVLVSNDAENVRKKAKNWRAKKNTYTIDPSLDQSIEAAEGTYLYFGSTQFVYEDGTPVNEPFTLSIEEYYAKADMIKARLSTTSDGRMLETGGMVNLQAYNKKGKIRIAEGSSYSIGFPKNGTDKDDFQLFYGEWREDDLINWRLANETINAETASDGLAVIDGVYTSSYREDLETGERIETRRFEPFPAAPPAKVASARMISPGEVCFIQINKSELRRDEKISKMDYFNWKLVNGQTLSQWFAGGFNPDAEMVDRFCEDKLRTEITFQVDQEGKFKSYYVSHSSTREYDAAIAQFIETMPALDLRVLMPKYVVDHACILSFGSMISASQQDFSAQFRKQFGADSTATVGEVKAGLMDYYLMSSTELGWINCDRFVGEEGMLVNYTVPLANPNCFVAMIFDEYDSILRGQYTGAGYTFNNVLKDQPIRLLVIDESSAVPLLAKAVSNTTKGTCTLKAPAPFHLHELDGLLQKPKPDAPSIVS